MAHRSLPTALLLCALSACSAPTAPSSDSDPCPGTPVTATSPGVVVSLEASTRCLRLPAGDFAVGVYSAAGAAPAAAPAPAVLPLPRRAPARVRLPSDLRVGARFPVQTYLGHDTAQVLDNHGGFIVALALGASAGVPAGIVERDRRAVRLALAQLPLLREAYGHEDPVTAPGGPLLILLTRWDPTAGLAATWTDLEGGVPLSYVILNLDARRSESPRLAGYDLEAYRVRTTVHELAHTYQARFIFREGIPRPVPAWALEGSADLLAGEAIRRHLGVPAGGNWRWEAHVNADDSHFALAVEPFGLTGNVGGGYRDAAAYLRWSSRHAVRSVAQTARLAMQEPSVTGPADADAVARWAAALALDERVTHGDPDFRDAAAGGSWRSLPATQPLTAETTAGQAGFVRLRGPGTFPLAPRPGQHWAIGQARTPVE